MGTVQNLTKIDDGVHRILSVKLRQHLLVTLSEVRTKKNRVFFLVLKKLVLLG